MATVGWYRSGGVFDWLPGCGATLCQRGYGAAHCKDPVLSQQESPGQATRQALWVSGGSRAAAWREAFCEAFCGLARGGRVCVCWRCWVVRRCSPGGGGVGVCACGRGTGSGVWATMCTVSFTSSRVRRHSWTVLAGGDVCELRCLAPKAAAPVNFNRRSWRRVRSLPGGVAGRFDAGHRRRSGGTLQPGHAGFNGAAGAPRRRRSR